MIPPFNYSLGAPSERLFEHLNQSKPFCSQYQNSKWYCYLLLALFTFVLPFGIIGNVMALLNYTFFRKTCTTSNVFLFNLALCDSTWIFTFPFTIYVNLERPYLRNIQIFCQCRKIFFNINVYGSILFLTLISFDRFAGTVHPIRSLRWWDVSKAKLCAACTWIALFLGCIPDLCVSFVVERGNATACMDHIQGPFAYVKAVNITRTLLGFVLPFSVMLVFYTLTLRVLRRLPRTKRHRGCQRTGKPTRLITASLVIFVVSFLPYHVMVVTLVCMRIRGQITAANGGILYSAYGFFEAICSISSFLDPVLYILASERFQRRLRAFRRGPHKRLCCRASRRVGVMG